MLAAKIITQAIPGTIGPWANRKRVGVMRYRDSVKLPRDVYVIDAIINNQMLKTSHDLLLHLVDLNNGINPDISTLNKDRGDIF